MKRKAVKPYLTYIAELGARNVKVSEIGSGHYRFTFEIDGLQHKIIAPSSPSDRRSFQNWKCDARKVIAGTWSTAQAARREQDRAAKAQA